MEYLWLVTLLAALQFAVFGGLVGAARAKSRLQAPAVTGDAAFERRFRVHYNTLEQLAVFYPALWSFGLLVDATIAAALGGIYLVGRVVYFLQYTARPQSRSLGFGLSAMPTYVLLIGGLIGAIRAIVG